MISTDQNQDCQLVQPNSSATSYPDAEIKGQDAVPFLPKIRLTTKSFCTKTKVYLLSFETTHLSLFFKEQRTAKL